MCRHLPLLLISAACVDDPAPLDVTTFVTNLGSSQAPGA